MDFFKEKKAKKSKKVPVGAKHDFALPIYIQRRQDLGITITCPDMNITRSLPLPHQYESKKDFYSDLLMTIMEVDGLAIDEFKEQDFKTKKKHRESLFPRGLKDHLEVDIHKLKFKPPQAALLTTKSERTWQRWCEKKLVKRRINGSKMQRKHYLIPFSEIEPYLKPEFLNSPEKIQNFS